MKYPVLLHMRKINVMFPGLSSTYLVEDRAKCPRIFQF